MSGITASARNIFRFQPISRNSKFKGSTIKWQTEENTPTDLFCHKEQILRLNLLTVSGGIPGLELKK